MPNTIKALIPCIVKRWGPENERRKVILTAFEFAPLKKFLSETEAFPELSGELSLCDAHSQEPDRVFLSLMLKSEMGDEPKLAYITADLLSMEPVPERLADFPCSLVLAEAHCYPRERALEVLALVPDVFKPFTD